MFFLSGMSGVDVLDGRSSLSTNFPKAGSFCLVVNFTGFAGSREGYSTGYWARVAKEHKGALYYLDLLDLSIMPCHRIAKQ